MPRTRPAGRAFARAALIALLSLLCLGAAPAAAGTLAGTMWEDGDRDGIRDDGEPAMGGRLVYLLDADGGRQLAYAGTDASGRYAFTGLADGRYRVETDFADWLARRAEWVPTTTGSVWPRQTVDLVNSATADFGWRRILRASTPLSVHTASDGLRVESYNDALTAREVHDALRAGTLIGEEASATTIRFDFGASPVTLTSVTGGPGTYTNYRADVRVPWLSWLDQGDRVLFHEYGHAWSLYYAHLLHQDTRLESYLAARGIAAEDPRLDTSHAWSRQELIAEDYRQVFGTANSAGDQENGDLPAAADVPGLRDFLATTFRERPAADPEPEPTPEPTPEPEPEPAAPLELSGLAMNPTPVKASGTAAVELSAPATVTIAVRDVKGVTVRTLASTSPPPGPIAAQWDRRNASGQRVKGGTYTLVAEAIDEGGRRATASVAFKVS